MTQKWGSLSSHIVPCEVVHTVSIFAAGGGIYNAFDGEGREQERRETTPQKTMVSPARLLPTSEIAQSKSIKMDMSTTMPERERLTPIIDSQRPSDA